MLIFHYCPKNLINNIGIISINDILKIFEWFFYPKHINEEIDFMSVLTE